MLTLAGDSGYGVAGAASPAFTGVGPILVRGLRSSFSDIVISSDYYQRAVICMQTTRKSLYSSVLENCKISSLSCYLEEPSATGALDDGEDARMRAEAYLFFSILNLRERVPVISASQAIDSGFMLGYVRRCQNPFTGANPFLEAFRRGYIRVFLDDGSSSLREYLRGCLRRDVRVAPSGGASPRFIFSSLSSVSSRSIPEEPRFVGDTFENRERELVALYGDMLARLEHGRLGLSCLVDFYYVWACEEWGDPESAALVRFLCESFIESLSRYSSAAEKGYRLLPERAACAFVVALGARERAEEALGSRLVSTEHLSVYRSICEALLADCQDRCEQVRSLSVDRLRALLHFLETINQVECYFEIVDMIDESTRFAIVPGASARAYLGPWCDQRLRDYSAELEKNDSVAEPSFVRDFLSRDIVRMSKRSEMYNELDRCAKERGPKLGLSSSDLNNLVDDTRLLLDGAYKDVMFLGAFGSISEIDPLAIACADIACPEEVALAYRRLRRICLKDARATQTGFVRENSSDEEQDLATSLCWEHFLRCKERMSAYARRRHGGEASGEGPERVAADIERFRRTLPLRTLARSVALFLVYVIFSLADDALFNPQGWVAALLSGLGIALPDVVGTALQSVALIVFLIAYELVADRIGALPSMGEVASLWRSFGVERQLVALVRGVGRGVLATEAAIKRELGKAGSSKGASEGTSAGIINQEARELIEFKQFVESRGSTGALSRGEDAAVLERMRSAAREMGNVMLRATVSLGGSDQKGSSRNLVTSYDRQIQGTLERLLTERERAVFLAEEDEGPRSVEGQAESNATCGYVIDPIDGTANFVFAVGHSCVSIARVSRSGEPEVAVVYDPDRDECFWATRGSGAYCNGRRLVLEDASDERDAGLEGTIGCVGTSPYDEGLLARFPRLAQVMLERCADIRRTGSAALDLCYVAAGRFSVYVEAGLSSWDVAAGALIVEEACGQVVTVDGDDVLSMMGDGSEHSSKFSIVAGTPARVELIRDAIAPVFGQDSGERLLGANQYVSIVEARSHGVGVAARVATRVDVLPERAGVVIAVRRGEELLLLRHRRPAVGETLLEMPRGGLEPGERSEDAARRELVEETGLRPTDDMLVRLGSLRPDSGILSTRVEVFLAEVSLDAEPRLRDGGEGILEYRFVGPGEVDTLIASGELTDGFTLATLSLLDRLG